MLGFGLRNVGRLLASLSKGYDDGVNCLELYEWGDDEDEDDDDEDEEDDSDELEDCDGNMFKLNVDVICSLFSFKFSFRLVPFGIKFDGLDVVFLLLLLICSSLFFLFKLLN